MNLKDTMKKYGKLILGILGLAAVIVWSGGFLTRKTKPVALPYAEGRALPADAVTMTVKKETVPTQVDVVGTVTSEERINLSARIPAYVSEIFASAGDRVKKGQTLVTLDDREIRQQLTAAEAGLNQARAEYERAKQLFEREATTQQALTAAESMYASARAQVEQVKVMQTYAKVVSPIDGIVTERRIEAGDLAHPGTLLLAVYDPLRMRLEAAVPVRLIDRIELNQEVSVLLERPARTLKGRVSEIVSEVDPSSRSQLVKVRLEGVTGDVLPGAFGRLLVEALPREVMYAPASALVHIGQLSFVQVVRDGRAVRRLVKTGPASGDRVEILSGLRESDVLLVTPIREG
ncbi:MAG: efflux RND transporter periplasmic adaptor subunit [Kiritimatiellia bacterium]|nr:efflux RND transporter periplasmic adaptor subunit [Kiritimatiellia bacterium]